MSRTLALIAIAIWMLLLSPYPTTIFISGAIAALTLPVYRWLRARMGRGRALACFSGGLVACIAAPITIVTVMVVPQALEGLRRLTAWWQAGHAIPPAISHYLNEGQRLFIENVPNATEYLEKIEHDFNDLVNVILRNILTGGLNLAGDTMGIAWAMCLVIVFTCLAVAYAPAFRRAALHVLPGRGPMLDRFARVFHNSAKAVFIGVVFVPLVQGTLTGIGLGILGVPDPAFWGVLAVFAAVIPMAGTAIVWLPVSVYLWATQSLTSALILVAWGTVVVSGADNILRPYFLKTAIEAPMVVLLLSIICGLAVFGAVGLIAGPMLVAAAQQAMKESDILYSEKHALGED